MILRVDKRKKVNCPFQIILSPLSTISWGKTSIMQPFLQKQISLTWDDSSSNHLQSDNKFFQLKTISAEAKRGGCSKLGHLGRREMPLHSNLAISKSSLYVAMTFQSPHVNVLHKMLLTKEF